ncbi:hypothetical protein [Paracoccus marinus]|uniref:hypothetical protein n=1 Tax=Paracoccus marinus TaxID=288426 RepID=UPI0010406EEF|nr:hypothetical protein [Paracoccus marinus]
MTDLSPRAPQPADGSSDVLASIRRLIAQDGGGARVRHEPPAPRRAAELVAAMEHMAADGGAEIPARPAADEVTPLRLQHASLVPPASPLSRDAAAPEPARPRLRLATLAGAFPEPPDTAFAAVDAPVLPVAADGAGKPALRDEPAHAPAWPARPAANVADATRRETAAKAEPVGTVDLGNPAADSVPANPAPAPAPAPAPTRAEDSTALHLFAPADEDIPNGSLLRNLLREAIRQELQGEMGGRFSRNLRRVIRQEVAYAVAEAMQPAKG